MRACEVTVEHMNVGMRVRLMHAGHACIERTQHSGLAARTALSCADHSAADRTMHCEAGTVHGESGDEKAVAGSYKQNPTWGPSLSAAFR